MALIVADRVMESTTTTGTGALALAGAHTGYQAFDDVCANGDTCYYSIEALDANGNPTGAWECGLGTFSDTDTLTRTTVHASSNAGAAVNFAAGTKRVMLSATATYLGTEAGGSGAFSGALVKKSADQVTANFTTGTVLHWNTEVYDTNTFHEISSTVTITIASPGVITWTGHNFVAGAPISLATTGALPTGLTAGTTYFVVNPAANTFQLSATVGGGAINTSGAQSGVHTATNFSRLTVPSGVSRIRLGGGIELGNVVADVFVYLTMMKNGVEGFPGSGRTSQESGSTGPTMTVNSAVISVVPGDYFELRLQIESDSSVTLGANNSWFSIEVVE